MTDQQYIEATKRIWELMNLPDLTPEQGAELSRLAEAVDDYESIHFPMDNGV